MPNIQQHSSKSLKKIMKVAKKVCEVCTQEHKQNIKILNVLNSLKEDIHKVQTQAIPYRYAKCTATPE